MKLIKEIILWIWQIPQNIGGLILLLIMGYDKVLTAPNGNKVYFSKKMSGGISLGRYSIIDDYYIRKCKSDMEILNLDVTKHEALGHGTQSRWLGPFYLFVIGIPSIVWASIYPSKRFPYTKNGYYAFYTEKWADKLAGIVRS
jgi:hypothetical protein